MSDLQTLQDMGFAKDRAEYALTATNNKGVEPAMEWLLAHMGEDLPAVGAVSQDTSTPQPAPAESAAATTTGTPSSSSGAGTDTQPPPATEDGAVAEPSTDAVPEAKSLKCDECQRLFKSHLEVEFHAAKSGHASFSESVEEKKPLTAEEKAAQLALLEEKLKQKRVAREEEEKVEAQQRERMRIRQGKEMVEAKRKIEEQEMAKLIDARRREKEEEKVARDRVRAQIEADKAARRAKMAGAASPPAAAAPVTTTTPSPTSPPVTKEYTHTRIQIRLPDGSTVTEQFDVRENLAAVRLFVQLNHYPDLPFRLMTAYPKHVFEEEDFQKPLIALGLVPSSVVIVSKCVQN